MRIFIVTMFLCLNLSAQNVESKNSEKSLIEVGSFLNFSKFKTKQNAGFYVGYWYRFPLDETNARLELGTSLGYSKSFYEFNYKKDGLLYPIRSEEFAWNLGARMVKEYHVDSIRIEWVSELGLHTLIFNDGDIPKDEPEKNDFQNSYTTNIDTNTATFSSLKIGQGIRFWKNNIGIGVQASYHPYRFWNREITPEGFNSFSIEAGLLFKF